VSKVPHALTTVSVVREVARGEAFSVTAAIVEPRRRDLDAGPGTTLTRRSCREGQSPDFVATEVEADV
jgi:hypothetical protein